MEDRLSEKTLALIDTMVTTPPLGPVANEDMVVDWVEAHGEMIVHEWGSGSLLFATYSQYASKRLTMQQGLFLYDYFLANRRR